MQGARVAGATNGGDDRPWNIANSYELYAYAARALRSRECYGDEAAVTALM